MFGELWLESLTPVTGLTTVQNGTALALLITLLIDLLIIVATTERRGARILEIIISIDFFMTLLWLYIEWYPSFVGVVIALMFALLGVYIMLGER